MASKRRIRRRSCKSKIRHIDSLFALNHARKLGFPWHAYRCKFCGGYHVGRYDRRAIQAMRARKRNPVRTQV